MARKPDFNLRYTSLPIPELLLDRTRLKDYFELFPVDPDEGPKITNFAPWEGYSSTLMVIVGNGFAPNREDNQVEVGGKPAMVVHSEANQLTVITDHETRTGPVKVTVAGESGEGPRDYRVLPWPAPSAGEDGPPVSYMGAGGGTPSAGTIPPTGTANMLVVPCYPTDMVPPNLADARDDIVDAFDNVATFYDQVSYGVFEADIDVTNFVALLDNSAHYHRNNGSAGYPNIDLAVMSQLTAECAQGAVDQGFNLNDYDAFIVAIYLPGLTVRAWGGWSESNFAYDDGAGTSINITTTSSLAMVAQRHDADWGRSAHEIGHGLVDPGLVLGEDVYGSDLIDPSEATADVFDLMGSHDSHPMFSGFYMHQLGWYDAANILDLEWDRNPYSAEFDIIAHGTTQDADPSRYHLIRIRVSEGLYYFIEVRQRPDPAAADPRIYDENIPLPGGGTHDGGVVVTKVITGTLDNNQQTRLITLLQEEERVLITDEEAIDPLRTLTIRVVDDNVQARPLVCRVRVEWAQVIADDPGGDFDLNITPWGPGWESVDIWVDRQPYGTYDNTDASGNPTGNGDEPRPMEINHFEARIRNDGTADATNVKVTHYAISPPGVGDNGTWTPLATNTIAAIPHNGSVVSTVDWVPLVGEHTCLKVAISQQLGEVTGSNNWAQENVFNFQPPAASVPDPVVMTVAVRNPLEEKALIMLSVINVPYGYYVYFPHRWVWLEALGEIKLDLLVIPAIDFRKMEIRHAPVQLRGHLPHVYEKKIDLTGFPASWMLPIGGVKTNVNPKHASKVTLDDNMRESKEGTVRVTGIVDPHIKDQKLRVDVTSPYGKLHVKEAITDTAGRFSAEFNLTRLEKSDAKGDQQGQKPPEAVWAFQAHIINAKDVAPADSNILWYRPAATTTTKTPEPVTVKPVTTVQPAVTVKPARAAAPSTRTVRSTKKGSKK